MTDVTGDLPPGYYTSSAPVVTDWASFMSFMPGHYHMPTSLQEVANIITGLIGSGQTLRVLGGLHSCATICASDVVIDTSRLPKDFTVNGTSVTASATMHAHEFTQRAAAEGLSLTALGGTDAQTLAGLVSTNTAGATIHTDVYETVDWVEMLTIVDGAVALVRYTRGEPNFSAAICSLGALGFITHIGFTLVPQLYFKATFELVSLPDTLNDLDATCAAHDFWRVEWLPENDTTCLMWHAEKIAPSNDPRGDYPLDAAEEKLRTIMKLDQYVFKSGPFLNEGLRLAYKYLVKTYQPLSGTGPMRNIIPCDRLAPLHVAMAEWAFLPADLAKAMDVCRIYFGENNWPNLATEIECTRTDTNFMSPWNFPDTPYIVKMNFQYLTDFLTDQEKMQVTHHLQGLWTALEQAGIPFKAHWGKINFLAPGFVEKLYDTASFLPLVQPLFVNPYIAERLGLTT